MAAPDYRKLAAARITELDRERERLLARVAELESREADVRNALADYTLSHAGLRRRIGEIVGFYVAAGETE